VAQGVDLRHDSHGDLEGRLAADVEADRRAQAIDVALGDSGRGEALATVAQPPPRAQGADIEGP
jgi:hypothetical protein